MTNVAELMKDLCSIITQNEVEVTSEIGELIIQIKSMVDTGTSVEVSRKLFNPLYFYITRLNLRPPFYTNHEIYFIA